MTCIRIADDASRDTIAQAIRALRFKQERMPHAWTERRDEVGKEIDDLVAMWLKAHE